MMQDDASVATRARLWCVSTYEGSLREYVLAKRGLLGITPGELAVRSGVSASDISKIESGKILLPGADKRRRLAKALRGFHAELLVNAGEITPEEIIEGANAYDPKRAKAVAPFPVGTPAARVVDLLKQMTEEEIGVTLAVAEFAARRHQQSRRRMAGD
jgi:transcriptional regulator with XRE-family HTH domain